MLFRLWGILPSEAGKQSPFVLFKLLDDIERAEEPPSYEMNEHLMMFYGK